MLPILTPDQPVGIGAAYLATCTAVVGAAGLTLAAHVHTRWPALRRFPLLGLHAVLAAAVVAAGFTLVGLEVLQPFGPAGTAGLTGTGGLLLGLARFVAVLLLGVLGGLAAIRLDRAVSTWANAKFGAPVRSRRPQATWSGAPRPAGIAAGSTAADLRRIGLTEARNDFAPSPADLQVRLWLLLVVGAAEELVSRGVLVALAMRLHPWPAAASGVLAAQLIFAASHVFFGWGQVLAKLPLAAVTVGLTAVTGTVLTAVVAHLVFNTWVWRYHRALPVVSRQSELRPAVRGFG